jgi:hypothetical protein
VKKPLATHLFGKNASYFMALLLACNWQAGNAALNDDIKVDCSLTVSV